MIKRFNNLIPSIPNSCYVSESVDIIGDVTLGESVSVWFGSVIRGDLNYIKIGNDSNIQDNSTIHVTTDTGPVTIGEKVTIGHNAIIHGSKINDKCLIGMGAIILDNANIGEGSIIAAGTLVPQNMTIPPRSLLMGIPAKIIRQTTNDELDMIIKRSSHYINLSNKYKE